MAKVYKIKSNCGEYNRLRDISSGHRIQYLIKLDKFTAKQWLAAHCAVMQSMTPAERRSIGNTQIKQLAWQWLNSPKEIKAEVKSAGIKINLPTKAESKIDAVFQSYLSDYCRPGINTGSAMERATRHCRVLSDFLNECRVNDYSELTRAMLAKYPAWRNANKRGRKANVAAADTVNQELNRLAAVIRHGVKYHNWQERYLLDGIKVKPSMQNTKTIKPFEISEIKDILDWLKENAEKTGNWYLHDMALLAVCSGMEAKALSLLQPEWFKIDLGILRVFDKIVSGVIDAKTQNRARDIPLTPTMKKIYERGYIFKRPEKKKGNKAAGLTWLHHYSSRTFERCEQETFIQDVNWHRFRHTCATARLSAGWQLVRVSRMLGHSNVGTTASHYAEFDLSASPAGFEGMLKVYGEFVRWLDEGYFG